VVLQRGVEAASDQMLLRLEVTSPDDLNVFEEI
jgi:hypothetical protein